MFEQAFATLQSITESNIHLQQELFNKWVGFWTGVPAPANAPPKQVQQAQKQWADFVKDLVSRERETLELQFSAGLKNIEDAFRLAEVKDPQELRIKTIEFWQKSIDCVRQIYEAQVRDFQAAAVKWADLVLKPVPTTCEAGPVPTPA
jgi:hypothetical protein